MTVDMPTPTPNPPPITNQQPLYNANPVRITQDSVVNIGNPNENRNDVENVDNTNNTPECCKKCIIFMLDVCSPTYRKILRAVFVSSVVFGWTLTSFVALNEYEPREINGVCSMEIWQYLFALMIMNLTCLSAYLTTWYRKTFRGAYAVNADRLRNNHKLCLYFIIIIQILMAMTGAFLIFNQCASQSLRATLIYNAIFSWIIIIVASLVLLLVFCGFFFASVA
jgi:hypothetical protein